jgi:MbtH protein
MSKVLSRAGLARLIWGNRLDLGGWPPRTAFTGFRAFSASPIGMRITMANPFEDPDASYRVLVNHEGQHSLWPATQPTPNGWTVAHDTDSRAACLEYIEKNWTDMRPKSLIEAQGG